MMIVVTILQNIHLFKYLWKKVKAAAAPLDKNKTGEIEDDLWNPPPFIEFALVTST